MSSLLNKIRGEPSFPDRRSLEAALDRANNKVELLRKAQNNYKQNIEYLEQQLGNVESRYKQLALRCQGDIETLQQQQKASEESYTHEINRVNRVHNAEFAELKREHEKEINTQRQRMESTHSQYVTKIMRVHDGKMAQKQAELDQTIQDAARRLDQQSSAHQRELTFRSLQYQDSLQKLREDIESLNAALLTNDDDLYRGEMFTTSGLPAQPDDKISAQFTAIEQMVDGIGRLQWKQCPAIWTNEVLDQVRGEHVDRALKKAIVQDLVWSLLYDHIFCSPFRVFQDEGRALEMQWSRAGGQGSELNEGIYQWPAPAAKIERWRYMTIKECRDALRPPVPSDLDPRSRLRKGFTKSLEQFESATRLSLGSIVALPTGDHDMFGRLFRKVATVWLEFAAHRCRIVIGLQGPANLSSEAKVAMAQSSVLQLTVVPTVGRYGNVMGTDLDSYKTIDQCGGSSIIIAGSSPRTGVASY